MFFIILPKDIHWKNNKYRYYNPKINMTELKMLQQQQL